MQFQVITLFPEMIMAAAGYGVLGRAIERDLLGLKCWTPRDFTVDRHRTVDDKPYGGGPGMVMKPGPLRDAVRAAKASSLHSASRVIYLTPQGRHFDQRVAEDLSTEQNLILVCGRYEGVDERFIDAEVDDEISVGDFVLSGGELASLIIVDAVARLLPGVLGDAESAEQDSFSKGLLDYPHYTRPENFDGATVPEVLTRGNHAEIAKWRLKESLGRTWLRRPELINRDRLDSDRNRLLTEFIQEFDRDRGDGDE